MKKINYYTIFLFPAVVIYIEILKTVIFGPHISKTPIRKQ